MINGAEKFADDDAKLKSKVESRNELESYAYSLKNQIGDKEKLGAKLSDEEKAKIEEVINEKLLGWKPTRRLRERSSRRRKKRWKISYSPSSLNCTRELVELLLRAKKELKVARRITTKMSYKLHLVTPQKTLSVFSVKKQ